MSVFDYKRRKSSVVNIGGVPLGGNNPIRIQSMTNTSTMDTPGSVAQIKRIVAEGADYVRLTAQGVREADNLAIIRSELRAEGITTPLVADIHFNPRAAFAAAKVVEKVRINPGNFVDPGRTFKKLTYTDEEYAAELKRIDDALTPFLDVCREHGTAVRIGVNHGSLSDRIMSRYGDTPSGMVESAMEFLRVCVKRNFLDVVISMKASNTVIMVETVRRLVAAMDKENMHFPLHLGVTEAGDGEDGRIKSAVGIGTLLADGIGDTIRVSLSEDPECEVPVARNLVNYITSHENCESVSGNYYKGYNPISPEIIKYDLIGNLGGENPTAVVTSTDGMEKIDAADIHSVNLSQLNRPICLYSTSQNTVGSILSACHYLAGKTNVPVVIMIDYGDTAADDVILYAAADFGRILLNGFAAGICIKCNTLSAERLEDLGYSILQAARRRFTKTEFISCPSCGRTLFDLQSTLKEIKAALAHLPGLKIGVMGCIVNGPGEMADADYGYVGAAAGHISLYKGKECVEKNIPASEALEHLIEILKADGKWQDKQ